MMISICDSKPMAPVAAKAREWPTVPNSRGDHQQPIKKPTKCADLKAPICAVVKFSSNPDKASSGPTPPEESCSKTTGRRRAARDINIGILVRLN